MSKALLKKWLMLTLLICIVTIWLDFRVALGFLLGALGSLLLYIRSIQFCDAVLSNRSTHHMKTLGRFLQNYAIMAIVLLVSALKPELLNVLASAFGLMCIKMCLILETFEERRNEDEHSASSNDPN